MTPCENPHKLCNSERPDDALLRTPEGWRGCRPCWTRAMRERQDREDLGEAIAAGLAVWFVTEFNLQEENPPPRKDQHR